MSDLIDWGNAPEWADRRGVVSRRYKVDMLVWFNDEQWCEVRNPNKTHWFRLDNSVKFNDIITLSSRDTTSAPEPEPVNWNNAPEWADQHGLVGTNRDPIWFNDTKYAYCETPDRTMAFNTTGDYPPFTWRIEIVQDVTYRPLSKFTVSQIKDAPPKVISLVSDDDVQYFESQGYIDQARKIYYIAGPMTGLPNFNRDAFNAAATKLTAAGHTALNPATLPDGLSQAQYMDICLAMLRCATHVQMLRGWDDSRGAFAERALALKLGLTVEYL